MKKILFLGAIASLMNVSTAKADEVLADKLFQGDRMAHLERMEQLKTQYDERAQSYLDGLYGFGLGLDYEDPALASMEFDPHMENVEAPQKPGEVALDVDTKKTTEKVKAEKPIETASGSKFLAGGQINIPTPQQ